MEEVKLRTLSVLVDNESGVLSQVSCLFWQGFERGVPGRGDHRRPEDLPHDH